MYYNIISTYRQDVSDIFIYELLNTYVYKFPYFTYNYDTKSTIRSNTNMHDKAKLVINNMYNYIYLYNNTLLFIFIFLILVVIIYTWFR